MNCPNYFSFFNENKHPKHTALESSLLTHAESINDHELVNNHAIDAPSNTDESNKKTLLENYKYNASMTLLQDLPQSIITISVMMHDGLKNDPNNPTGVSLPGYWDLIPQLGNTIAGLAAAHEAMRLITVSRTTCTSDNVIQALLYTVFSVSTIANGLTNISVLLGKPSNTDVNTETNTDLISTVTTLIALTSCFLILCREELKLFKLINAETEQPLTHTKENMFHLICSLNLNVSIITASLVTLGQISRDAGAYGYLFGTWFGQVPELIEPTIHILKPCFQKPNTTQPDRNLNI